MLYSDMTPDWIITVDGAAIDPNDVEVWTVTDDEKTASAISVTLQNTDYRYSGKVKISAQLEINFGYIGFLVGKAKFPIMAYHENYTTNEGCYITIIAKDPTQQTGGGKSSGNNSAKSAKDMVSRVLDPTLQKGGGGKAEVDAKNAVDATNEDGEPADMGPINENDWELLQKILPLLSGGSATEQAKEGSAGQSVYPDEGKPIEGHEGDKAKGDLTSGTGGKSDQGRGNQSGGQGGEDPVTAQIQLIGYPQLKSKMDISIGNVGPHASGTYYVKQCKHSIKKGGANYTTSGSLVRGGVGKGGSAPTNGCSPVVMYANIYGSGAYAGERKYGNVQDTLMFGEGGPIISFNMTVSPQPNRGGGGGKGASKGHDLTNKAKAKLSTKDPSLTKSGEASGANDAGSGGAPTTGSVG